MRRLREDRGDEGISLIEVVIALIILVITLVPLTYVLTSAVSGAANARQQEAAIQLADSWVEILSNSSPPTQPDGSVLTSSWVTPTAPPGTITPKSTLAGTPFIVQSQYSYVSVTGQSDLCTDEEPPSSSHPGVIELQVKVSWASKRQWVTDTTNINYPRPGLQTDGFLAVQVNNSAATDVHGNLPATRVQAVAITVSGGSLASPLTLQPDANGCAFAQIPPGTYNLLIDQPGSGTLAGYVGSPPFVDPSGNTSPAFSPPSPETIYVTNETATTVTFDEGITSAISYGGASAIDGGVTCPGTSSLTCLTTGNGSSGAVAAWGGDGSTWSSTTLGAATDLSQVACTTGSSPTCVAVGYKRSAGNNVGVILTTSSDLGSTSADTPPAGVTDVTAVSCPSNNGCYAIGTTATGPVLLAGAVGQTSPSQDTWVAIAPPSSTFTSLSSVECVPTTTTCMVGDSLSVSGGASSPGILRLDGDPSALASNPSWTPTFSLESPPPALTSVGAITCPTSTECLAIATGDSTSATDPTILSASVANSGPDTWDNESTFPSGMQSVTGLSCTSSNCVAIGTGATGGPAVWTGDLTASPDDWAQAPSGYPGIPTTVASVTSVACGATSGGDTADCVVAGNTTSSSNPSELLEGTLNGGWAWNQVTTPTSSPVLYYTGLDCVAPGSGSDCAATAATAGGPVIVTASKPNDNSWNVETPSSFSGNVVNGIPLQTSPAGSPSWTTQITQAQATPTNATSLPSVLYPLPTGYSIAAGDCPAEATNSATAALVAPPGGTASVTVPLSLLPLEVVNPANGSPVSGAVVRLTSTQCAADTYRVPTTDAEGLSHDSIPYGTYTYTVNGTAVTYPDPNTGLPDPVTLALGINTVTLTNGASTSISLPGPVVVPS